MGVAGLWAELQPAAVEQTFEEVALEVFDDAFAKLEQGNALNRDKLLGLRVGVDASAWFFHSESGEGGANPQLRTLFHRVIRLARCGVLALFVFDGPHRPAQKRGKYIYRGQHEFQKDFIRIIEALGYEWRVAPGEAEAELAMLNARGTLDLVITDDVDCLLFGAVKVMKHAFINKPTSSIYPCIYERCQIELETDLTIPGLILVALMSGGDYDLVGLAGIGPTIAVALAKGNFGKALADAVDGLSGHALEIWLQDWRTDIRHELTTNERGLLPRKAAAAAKSIPDSWPDITTLKRYYDPVTSRTAKYAGFEKDHTWSGEINIGSLVQIMDELFEYLHIEILQKLRTLIWPVITVHHLIRSLSSAASSGTDQLTPSKKLAAQLSHFGLSSPAKPPSSTSSASPSLSKHLLAILDRIEKARKRRLVCSTPELQLVLLPASLANEAKEYLRHPDPNIGKLDARKAIAMAQKVAESEPGQELPGPAKPRNYIYEEVDKEQTVFVQESLLRMACPKLVEAWEEREREKADKRGRGKRGMKNAAPVAIGSRTRKVPPIKQSKLFSTALAPTAATRDMDDSDIFSASAPILTKQNDTASSQCSHIATSKARPARNHSSASPDSSDVELITARLDSHKSPHKSPRTSANHQTARQSLNVSASVVGKIATARSTKPTLPPASNRTYGYQGISDTDEELPDLPSLGVRASLASAGTRQAKSAIPSASRISSLTRSSPEVIDLCSSD
ncbi:MAG: hypothetical protein CYPHOPRED_000468 [Cyphobasidiales sp. Tagirdzhanova-0007]|nr:MAG: hypothetical protein CYPHOPRED_000468 [Cyphobasidiales sp. Tagirdzhanova-0007]